MAEVTTLVSWDALQDLGKIPGSDWMCPVGSLDALGAIARDGRPITDETIKEYAQGRQQHLEAVKFPEGYRAVKVIESETGRVLTGEGATYRYAGLTNCNCGAIHDTPAVTSVLSERPIDISEGREITSVYNFHDGTQTVTTPKEVGKSEPDYISRLRTTANITPQSRSLYVAMEGSVGPIGNTQARLEIRQNNLKIMGELVMFASDGWGNTGQLNLGLDKDGQVEKLSVYKRGFLEALGVNAGDFESSPSSNWVEIVDSRQQALVLGAMAEALGFGTWQGLDLRSTASGLYAAMGRRNLDLTSVLVPRS
jgi:hypothetical protein